MGVSLKFNFAFFHPDISRVISVICFLCTINLFPGVVITNDHKSGGLKPQTFILLPFLETRRLRSRCPRAALPPEAPGEGPSRLFQLLGAPGVPGLVAASLPSLPLFTWLLLCVWVSPLLSLRRTLSLDVGPPSSRRTTSRNLHGCKDPISKYSPVQGLGLQHVFWGVTVYPKALSIKCWRSACADARRSRLLISVPLK